ncbi:hypothetical protein MXB_3532 [Myxobolus squamalis]|nr:hypothetical protein MXB_3532 [Myxobolus squamalis]
MVFIARFLTKEPSFEVKNVKITGCGEDICFFQRNEHIELYLDFISNISISRLRTGWLFFPYNLKPTTKIFDWDACGFIAQGCPLNFSTQYQFKILTYIPDDLEKVCIFLKREIYR